MKKLIVLLLTVFSITTISAQAPLKIGSQMVVRDSNGDLVQDAPIQIRITFVQGIGGSDILQELHSPTTNINGLASFIIGEGSVNFGSMDSLDWKNGPWFIRTEVDATNSTAFDIVSTTEVLSVPYAISAGTDNDWEVSSDTVYVSDKSVGIGTSDPQALLEVTEDARINGLTIGRGSSGFVENTAVGAGALLSESAGLFSTAIGYGTLAFNTGEANTAAGAQALFVGIGSYNSAYGVSALAGGIGGGSGNFNSAFGVGAFGPNDGDYNAAFGNNAMGSAFGNYNSAFGNDALVSNTGNNNSAFGNNAMGSASGSSNAAFGNGALYENIGDYNIGFGEDALRKNVGNYNSAFGSLALYNNEGSNNVAVGLYSLVTNTSGDYNTALGNNTLDNNSIGNYNTAIGYGADVSSSFLTNATAIGANATVSQSNSLVLGNDNVSVGIRTSAPNEELEVGGDGRAFFGDGNGSTRSGLLIDGTWQTYATRIESYDYGTSTGLDLVINEVGNGNVGIKVMNPSVSLDVSGSIEYTGTITDVSDERLKENFEEIDEAIASLSQIQGFTYNMIGEENENREFGVKAQELQEVFPDMVSIVDEEHGYLGVSYVQLIPVLLEAIKEQQEMIDELKEENSSQNEKMDELREENTTQAQALNSNTALMKELQSILNQQSKK